MSTLRLLLLLILGSLLSISIAEAYDGKIIDAKTKAPVEGAVVTVHNEFLRV